MKNLKKYLGFLAVSATVGFMAQSCAVDEPFDQGGEGVLQMKLVINSDVTRAETDPADLSSNCVVYISGQKGLMYKYKGIENVPEKLNLKNGHYVAEAWTGDSVPASFDSKFYRGYQPFDINGGLENVVLKCRIANVVVSVNSNTIQDKMMSDWNINVAHSKGALDFTDENMGYAKGYFMMPNADKDLTVTVTGTNAEGKQFTKVQAIPDVERSHEYVLNFSYNPDVSDPTDGGAFLTITVDDSEVIVEDEVEIFGRPAISGVEFDASRQIIGNAGSFSDMYIKVNCFGAAEHIYLNSEDYAAMHLPSNEIDLPLATEQVKALVMEAGILWEETFKEDRNLVTGYLTLSAKWLNSLAERDQEYVLNVMIVDKYGKSAELPVRIAVGEGAVVIDDPVTVNDVPSDDLMAVLTNRANLSGSIVSADAVNPGIRYREAGGSGEWNFVAADPSAVRNARRHRMSAAQAVRSGGTPFSVVIKNLKPATRYEYQAVADGFNSTSKYFTTEGKFEIPNASFETWGTYRAKVMLKGETDIVFPGTDRATGFWESGNEGAAAGGMVLTSAFSDFKHSGNNCAKLETNSALGIMAAGNIFAGTYVETDGTNGVLSFGRDYDSSHPDALRVWARYRPGSNVTVKSGNESLVGDLVKGGTDQGQIFVALTTEAVEIRTNPKKRKLFDPDGAEVVAYGQVTWKEAFGPDAGLQQLDIPLTYKSNAKTTKPLKLVIVCAASKYGDYFSGAKGSVIHVDDFELIYE